MRSSRTRPRGGKVTATRAIAELGTTVATLSNGVEVWMKPTDFKNDQVLFSAYALGGTSSAPEPEFHGAELVSSLVGVGGLGGFSPVDLSRMLAGKIASATPSVGTYTTEIGGSSTPRDIETALQLNYLAFTAAELHAGDPRPAEAAPWRGAREPGPESEGGFRREGQPGEHVEPLLRSDGGDVGLARVETGRHAAVLSDALRQRGRLHVLHRGRVQRCPS